MDIYNEFPFKEDTEFFEELLNVKRGELDRFSHLFDFREPAIKRKEFNNKRKSILKHLLSEDGEICRLGFDCCDINSGIAVDHVIPLSSNVLNKRIRKVKPEKGKKVPTQSFGSNHIDNLIVACNNCNGKKKHNFLDSEKLQEILENIL